jgi:hypothetical protein
MPVLRMQLNESLSVQPCPTAAEVAQVSGTLQASALFIQEALDIMESGIVLSVRCLTLFGKM